MIWLKQPFPNRTYKYSYELETEEGFVNVMANNRTQAAAFGRMAGYDVRSVSFTG